jgi:hypothetical protein
MAFRPWRRGLYAFFLDFQEGYETFHPPTLGLCDHFNPLKRELLCLVNRHPLAGYLVHSWSEWYGLILSAIVLSFFLGTGPEIFLKRKNSVKLLMNAT